MMATVTALPTSQSPPLSPLPEAVFSLCLKGRLGGQDAQLTIRGATYEEFAANVAAVRGLLDPVASPEAEGRHCALHGVPMTQQSNARHLVVPQARRRLV
jgi:hypothetical protein